MERQKNAAFLLRMSPTVRLQAAEQAALEGLSLNQFISMAVAEKLVRLEILRSAQSARTAVPAPSRLPNSDLQAVRRFEGSFPARPSGRGPTSAGTPRNPLPSTF